MHISDRPVEVVTKNRGTIRQSGFRLTGLLIALLAFLPLTAHATTIFFLQGNDNTLDSSPNGNNGAWVGTPSYAPAVVGDGFNLTGSNYVSVPAGAGLNIPPSTPIKLSAYVDPTNGLALASERIIDKITAGGSDGYLLDIINDHFRVILGSTALTGTFLVPLNVFTQVSVIFSNTTLSLFENGTLDVSTNVGSWVDGGSNLRIGADSNGQNTFVGVIDQASLATLSPEPVSFVLLGLGLVALIPVYRRRAS
jgi:hypothetical protein